MDEVGCDEKTGTVRVTVNPKYYRPTEVVCMHENHFPTCYTYSVKSQ